jgi:hypothetical protein
LFDKWDRPRVVKALLEGLFEVLPRHLVVHDDGLVQKLQLVGGNLSAIYLFRTIIVLV